ncbi:procollagen C-endopeptidase enhancer 2-like [Palaemon carinicauda]|uniref:procollagen C-endopeptidase enhancer 2-like n=1 Tax=Palaemon carinicauda TaxID=392227 RepID=UPI0035B5AD37
MPVIKPPYVCADDTFCDLSSVSCYQKAAVGEAFSGKDLDKGKVKARKIRNIPMERRWNWPLPKGKVLRITFTFFDLGPCCACAFLEVRHSVTGALLGGPFCGVLAVPFSVVIPSNKVEVYLYSDGSQVLEGFEFDYDSLEAYACDPALEETTGEITAKNILNFGMTCTWRMNFGVGMMVKMTFTAFDLGTCCNCAQITILDYEFTQFPVTGYPICGTSIPTPIPATMSGDIDITLYTDGLVQHPGFHNSVRSCSPANKEWMWFWNR